MRFNTYLPIQHLDRPATISAGGICEFFYAKKEDVFLWPLQNPQTGTYTDEVILQDGASWYRCQVIDPERDYKEESKSSEAGPFVEMQLRGFLPDDSPLNTLTVGAMPYHEYVIVLQERNGIRRLIGSEDAGAKFSHSYDSSDGDGTRGRTLVFTYKSQAPAAIYLSVVTATGQVINPPWPGGGGPELDPTVPQWVKAITAAQILNWNLAYSWGNHATAGYLTEVLADSRYSQLGHTHALSTLSDVTITAPADAQLLRYDISSGKWVNWTPTFAPGNHTHHFADLLDIPTTIAGYGITDFNPTFDARLNFWKNVPGGVGGLDPVTGKLPTSVLPALATTETFTVASQAEMLALDAQRGDFAVRTELDPSQVFILAGDDPEILANWISVSVGGIQVINGQSGANVTLTTSHIGEGSNLYFSNSRARAALSAGAGISYTAATGVIAANFGTTAGTVAQGNDSRIINGQTAFGWGNHAGLYVPLARTVTAGIGLTGGGDLSANRSFAIDPAYTSFTNYYTKTNLQTSGQAAVHWGNLTNVPGSFPTTSNLQTVLGNGNTATNSITLGANGNSTAFLYNIIRRIASTDYTSTVTTGVPPGGGAAAQLAISDGATTKSLYVRHADAAPTYTPDGTNLYTLWHSNNHPAGSAFTPTLTGANVLSSLTVNSAGHVSALTTRALTAEDIGAQAAGSYVNLQGATPGTAQTGHINISGTLTAATVTSPSSNDLSISAPSGQRLLFNPGGTNRGVWDGDGRLGIGTVPNSLRASMLEVAGNVWSTDAYLLGTGSTPVSEYYMAGSNAGIRTMNGTANLTFDVNQTTEVMRITPTARVGIGTTNPAAKLHVSGIASVTGSIGVETTSPEEKLDVRGYIVASQGPSTLSNRTVVGYTTGGGYISGETHNGTSWNKASMRIDAINTLMDAATVTGSLTNAGSRYYHTRTITATTTALTTDHIIVCNSASGNITLNLPSAVGIDGFVLIVKKSSSSNIVTIDPSGSEVITTYSGDLTTVPLPAGSTEAMTLMVSGGKWMQL